MSLETKHFYEFGDFRLDPSEKVLSRGGKPVAVTPKVFETLQILVENAGHLVQKQRLIEKIWQDRFVEESNLTFNVKMLRKALGDSAHSPRFVETVPRRGYRFIAEVREIPAEEKETSPPPALAAKILQPPKSVRLPAAILVVLLLCSVALTSWLARDRLFDSARRAPLLAAPFRAEKFSSSGKVHHAVISPDGRLVAYTDEAGGKHAVWLKRLETSENVQIVPPSEDVYFGLAFARDGQSLFFVRKPMDDNAPTAVLRVSVFGGVPEKILEKTEGWISLSPDDRQISFVRCAYEDEDYCSLFAADADGKNERKLLTRARPIRIGDNQFAPDGKSIAFAAGQSASGGNDFHLLKIDLASGAESEISPRPFFNVKSLKWLPDGEGLLAAAMENLDGKLRIWHVSTATGEWQPLTNDVTNYSTISLSGDGDKMAATQVGNNFRLYYSADGETVVLTAARWLAFAPDGKIVYSADDGDIWTVRRDGGEQRQLTKNPAWDYSPRVSPDNRFVFFTSNRTGANQVWRMNIDGSNQVRLTETEGGYPCFATPDGRWVYYRSGVRQTLWRVSTDGGGEAEVLARKMENPAFTSDARLVAYFFRDSSEWKIGVTNAADGATVKTLDYAAGKSPPVSLAWAGDNRTLYFAARRDARTSLWRQALDEDEPHFVADFGGEQIAGFALAPEGGGFAYLRGSWLHDAVLIDGLK